MVERMRVLIAIEPRSYREFIGTAIQELRPNIETTITEPEELGREVARLNPDLVICERPQTFAHDSRGAWVEFRPYAELAAKVYVNGRTSELGNVDLDDLLSVIDEVKRLG